MSLSVRKSGNYAHLWIATNPTTGSSTHSAISSDRSNTLSDGTNIATNRTARSSTSSTWNGRDESKQSATPPAPVIQPSPSKTTKSEAAHLLLRTNDGASITTRIKVGDFVEMPIPEALADADDDEEEEDNNDNNNNNNSEERGTTTPTDNINTSNKSTTTTIQQKRPHSSMSNLSMNATSNISRITRRSASSLSKNSNNSTTGGGIITVRRSSSGVLRKRLGGLNCRTRPSSAPPVSLYLKNPSKAVTLRAVGEVVSVDNEANTVDVKIWKHGLHFQSDPPIHTYALHHLTVITRNMFREKVIRDEFMERIVFGSTATPDLSTTTGGSSNKASAASAARSSSSSSSRKRDGPPSQQQKKALQKKLSSVMDSPLFIASADVNKKQHEEATAGDVFRPTLCARHLVGGEKKPPVTKQKSRSHHRTQQRAQPEAGQEHYGGGISRLDQKLQALLKKDSKSIDDKLRCRMASLKKTFNRDEMVQFGILRLEPIEEGVAYVNKILHEGRLILESCERGTVFRARLHGIIVPSMYQMSSSSSSSTTATEQHHGGGGAGDTVLISPNNNNNNNKENKDNSVHGKAAIQQLRLLILDREVTYRSFGSDPEGFVHVDLYVGRMWVQARLVKMGLAQVRDEDLRIAMNEQQQQQQPKTAASRSRSSSPRARSGSSSTNSSPRSPKSSSSSSSRLSHLIPRIKRLSELSTSQIIKSESVYNAANARALLMEYQKEAQRARVGIWNIRNQFLLPEDTTNSSSSSDESDEEEEEEQDEEDESTNEVTESDDEDDDQLSQAASSHRPDRPRGTSDDEEDDDDIDIDADADVDVGPLTEEEILRRTKRDVSAVLPELFDLVNIEAGRNIRLAEVRRAQQLQQEQRQKKIQAQQQQQQRIHLQRHATDSVIVSPRISARGSSSMAAMRLLE